MRAHFWALVACLTFIAGPINAHAEVACPESGSARTQPIGDEGACVQQLSDGVYAIIHADASDEWPHGNTGVIVGRNSVFVIDSTYLPSRARADIALIRQITPKPVRYLVTTHWHMHHNNGASAYFDAFSNLTYLVERETARWMQLNQHYWANRSTAANAPRRAALATLEQQLARGVDENGAVLGNEARARLQAIVTQRRGELEELASLRVIAPTQLFDGVLLLNFEGRRIEIRNWGRANSPSDTTYYLPREQVLFAGDILVAPLPYTLAVYPHDWEGVLHQIEAIPVRALVPGHGPVMSDHAYTRQVGALMSAVNARVEASIARGRSVDETQAATDLNDVRAAYENWRAPNVSDEDWTYSAQQLVDRAWHNLRGQEYEAH